MKISINNENQWRNNDQYYIKAINVSKRKNDGGKSGIEGRKRISAYRYYIETRSIRPEMKAARRNANEKRGNIAVALAGQAWRVRQRSNQSVYPEISNQSEGNVCSGNTLWRLLHNIYETTISSISA